MAYTTSVVVDSVFGNQRVKVLNVTADGAEANLSTGLELIAFSQVTPISGITGVFKDNVNSSGTVANGTIGISGAVNGAVYRVVVYGA